MRSAGVNYFKKTNNLKGAVTSVSVNQSNKSEPKKTKIGKMICIFTIINPFLE